jgi:cysteine-rich repeat protein
MRNHHFGTRFLLAAVGALPLTFLACGGDATGVVGVDSGTDGAITSDTGPHKDASKDAAKDVTADTGAKEAGAKDTGPAADTSVPETGPSEAGAPEAGPGDAGLGDVVVGLDSGADAGHDAGVDTGTSAAVCGNGVIEGAEQCDDGNLLDLDGCDSKCKYEVVTRMSSISISGSTGPAFCVHTANALGKKALTTTALGQLNPDLTTDVNNGTVNVLTQFLGLTDLTGTTDTGFSIGVLDGTLDPAKGTWPAAGTAVDWWFLADPNTVSAGLPTGLLTAGTIAAHGLTAGPSTVNLSLNLGGSPANLEMRDAKIAAAIGTATDTPAPPPSALAAGLVVFETITATGAADGLCGDITVGSLAQIPIPQVLTMGLTNCTAGYTYCGTNMPVGATCNSLLDVLIGGCKVAGGFATAVNATQPDVPPAGVATVTTLVAGANKKVTVPAAADSEAYSAFLQFAANREHFTGESCTASTQCQTGQACTAGVCK